MKHQKQKYKQNIIKVLTVITKKLQSLRLAYKRIMRNIVHNIKLNFIIYYNTILIIFHIIIVCLLSYIFNTFPTNDTLENTSENITMEASNNSVVLLDKYEDAGIKEKYTIFVMESNRDITTPIFGMENKRDITNPQCNIIDVTDYPYKPDKSDKIPTGGLIYKALIIYHIIKYWLLLEALFYCVKICDIFTIFGGEDTVIPPVPPVPPAQLEVVPPTSLEVAVRAPLSFPESSENYDTMIYPSFIGPEIHDDDYIFNLSNQFEAEILLHSQQLLIQNDGSFVSFVPTQKLVICDYLYNHPLKHNLFSLNSYDLQDRNHIVNLLIQKCVMLHMLTNNEIYYNMALGLFIQQTAIINNDNPFNYYENPSVYYNIAAEFEQHFLQHSI